jgi:hypothetical protein
MLMNKYLLLVICTIYISTTSFSQSYPRDYFRSPLNIPMQLVANFGEIRANHWHMGLDIRTQHRVNLPVYSAAEGYIARVSVEPGGFGQAIYINHPNGYTTVYGHLNSFFPALAEYIKEQQYKNESWKIDLEIPTGMFPVEKGQFIALSGSTGASEGPHVHFEIRNTKTGKNLNPLLFRFPIADNVAPPLLRLAMYDRNRSTYEQSPVMYGLHKTGAGSYILAGANTIRTGSDHVSFAIGAVDHFSNSTNPNGIYSASVDVDGQRISGFVLDNISYDETRYINAQLDYPYHSKGGAYVQHISPLPGARAVAYHFTGHDGTILLKDNQPHEITIEVSDANGNTSTLKFQLQYDQDLKQPLKLIEAEKLLPNNVNVIERPSFEVYTTEQTIYDSIPVTFASIENNIKGAISPQYQFLSASVPAHDSFTIRIKPSNSVSTADRERIVIKNISGAKTFVERAEWQNGWLAAKFRQFGTFQVFVDNEPPTINSPLANLSRAGRIVFVPHDNFNTIRSFRAELDGKWLRFSNDKGHSWIYDFDGHFPKGSHELKVILVDEAGNVTTRKWIVIR